MNWQPLVLLSLSSLGFIMAVTMLRGAARRHLMSSLRCYSLSFPRGLEVEAVENFLAGLSGLLLPWWRRWFENPFVVLETTADVSGIHHLLIVPEAWERSVLSLLSANLPGVRFTPADMPTHKTNIGAEYRLTSNHRELGGEAEAVSARTLASLHPLGRSEAVVVQWTVTPHAPVAPAKLQTSSQQWQIIGTSPELRDGEAVGALRTKQSKPMLLAVGRIAVSGDSRDGRRRLLRQAEVGLLPITEIPHSRSPKVPRGSSGVEGLI